MPYGALECPTKLFYVGNKEYKDSNSDNDFLKALAEGGFQVGELAKLYYPGGVTVDTLDYMEAVTITRKLLQSNNVVIFEAAFKFKNLFIRADIVEKNGDHMRIIEVKSKSYEPGSDDFLGKKGGITSKWKPYIYDIAFQKYVVAKCHPEFKIKSFLCLTDKSQKTSVEGLNQLFFLYSDGNRTRVKLSNTAKDYGSKILIEVCTDEPVDKIIGGEILPDENYSNFDELIHQYADSYKSGTKIQSTVSAKCKACEFNATMEERASGYKSGFRECWQKSAGFKETDFEKPSILDIWNFRRKDEFLPVGKYFMDQVTKEDIEGKSTKSQGANWGLSRTDRQYMQVEKARDNDGTIFLDIEGLKSEMEHWRYPLHFIDFETTAVAIPFNKGRRPYEQIAFQFSHHTAYSDGTIEHSDEWINTEQGFFPNFQFVRELKNALDKDNGSIFRYAAHENSILNAIYIQLKDSNESDRIELCDWIKTITKSKSDSVEKWEGERNMIDLLELVKKYYYDPQTNGSNSLKFVLPAVINSSDFIKEKYSKPIYGFTIKSSNYKDHSWIVFDQLSKAINPYKLLAPINQGYDNELLDSILIDDEMGIADGGSAMIAYARMQFTEMNEEERKRISKALLKYCELDTFAMVVLWEAWKNWCFG